MLGELNLIKQVDVGVLLVVELVERLQRQKGLVEALSYAEELFTRRVRRPLIHALVQVGLVLDERCVDQQLQGVLYSVRLHAYGREVGREVADVHAHGVERVVELLAAVHDEAERQAEQNEKHRDEELVLGQVGGLLEQAIVGVARVVAIELYGARVARAHDQAAGVDDQHEEYSDEEEDGGGRPEQNGLQVVRIVGVEGRVGEGEPHVEVGQRVEDVDDVVVGRRAERLYHGHTVQVVGLVVAAHFCMLFFRLFVFLMFILSFGFWRGTQKCCRLRPQRKWSDWQRRLLYETISNLFGVFE